MNIKEVINKYDSMFAANTPDEISAFLIENINRADIEGDKASLITLLNEQIGFSRDRGMRDAALAGCRRLRSLIDEMGLAGTLHYGRSLLNIANAYRAFGLQSEAESLFYEIEQLYVTILPEGSYEYAPLYNNWSLLAMDTGHYERACDLIRLSIDVADRYERAEINQATSRVNLACALMGMSEDTEKGRHHIDEAAECIDKAIDIFEKNGGDDYHFAAALSAKGDILMKAGEYGRAANHYERAAGIVRMYTGNNSKTETLEKKIQAALKMVNA